MLRSRKYSFWLQQWCLIGKLWTKKLETQTLEPGQAARLHKLGPNTTGYILVRLQVIGSVAEPSNFSPAEIFFDPSKKISALNGCENDKFYFN